VVLSHLDPFVLENNSTKAWRSSSTGPIINGDELGFSVGNKPGAGGRDDGANESIASTMDPCPAASAEFPSCDPRPSSSLGSLGGGCDDFDGDASSCSRVVRYTYTNKHTIIATNTITRTINPWNIRLLYHGSGGSKGSASTISITDLIDVAVVASIGTAVGNSATCNRLWVIVCSTIRMRGAPFGRWLIAKAPGCDSECCTPAPDDSSAGKLS